MRISSALASILLLAACAADGASPPGDAIECALGPGADFEAVCTLERVRADEADMLVLHHPDGGFRRLTVLPDGKGVAPTDGAAAVAQSLSRGTLEVAIDGDRYRLPARPMEATPGD